MQPSGFQDERKAGKLIVCKEKPVALFNQGTWGVGQLELRQQRALQTLELLPLLCPGREFVAPLIAEYSLQPV